MPPLPRFLKRAGFTLVLSGALFLLVGLAQRAQRVFSAALPSTPHAPAFNARRVCTDAWEQEAKHLYDYRAAVIPYFDVTLTTDECFGPNVLPPAAWREWEKEFVSNEPDRHVSFWFAGGDPIGPYGPNNMPEFNSAPRQWRLKGKGTLRYFLTGSR